MWPWLPERVVVVHIPCVHIPCVLAERPCVYFYLYVSSRPATSVDSRLVARRLISRAELFRRAKQPIVMHANTALQLGD